MKRLLRIRWLLLFAAALALLITWNWYVTRPSLEWRTQDFQGYRLRPLVPAGWKLDQNYSGEDFVWKPPKPGAPGWLRWLWPDPDPDACVWMFVNIPYRRRGILEAGYAEGREILTGPDKQCSGIWRSVAADRAHTHPLPSGLVLQRYEQTRL